MITWMGYDDILRDAGPDAPTKLCPINAAGAMGAGLAKAMRDAFPGLEDAYRTIYCHPTHPQPDIRQRARNVVHLMGFLPSLHRGERRLSLKFYPRPNILLFCTKYHWREHSPLDLVEDNLRYVAQNWKMLELKALDMPVPGSGLGGLPQGLVLNLIETYLGPSCELPVRVFLGKDDPTK